MRTLFLIGSLVASLSSCATGSVSSDVAGPAASPSSAPFQGGFAELDGLRMYYEIHGEGSGTPLVLLHGGGSTIDVTWGRILPFLARGRQVIAVEEQAHGRTSDRDTPVRHESSADDVAALLRHLRIEKADVFGFSNGAGVALQVAIRHPARVRKLVFASYMTKRSGTDPGFWQYMRKATLENMPQPLKDAFLKVNPDPAKLRTMCEKDIDRMLRFKDVPDRDVASLRLPTLILQGDRDVPKLEHATELSRLIPGARLLILPGGHGEFLGELLTQKPGSRAPQLTAALVEDFLEAP